MKLKSLGIIPARIGSSEVKKKNIRLLKGRPLIYYTINAAINSNLDRVIVSTDSIEIAEIAKSLGAEVPFLRPKFLSGNKSRAIDVISHTLNWLKVENNWVPDLIGYLQPTSPMRTKNHIDKAISMIGSKFDSVLSVTRVKEHPYFMFKKNKDNMEEFIKNKNKPERRQELPDLYYSNPLIMFSKYSYLQKVIDDRGIIINYRNFNPLYINEFDGIDINSEQDLYFAELMMQEYQNSSLKSQKILAAG
ncbi:MAG: N-acylneuraminate cytidylyltransferase [Alphaproteobacteria bacterium MarineAlpha2_Bin1]|nr:MAG: N-acylneuraminate cytidylyltransferase [Alphaproteobacteria bacterium MarineAlpha2_Bin1]|tara:strand:+ start:853 stop:1596 length:744 start_codon:yes stop_codon:yes gene_type:complete